MVTDSLAPLPPLAFDLSVARAEPDGIEMGVLGDGSAYLSTRGLARACGQPPSVIHQISEHWGQSCHELHCRRIEYLLSEYTDGAVPRFREIPLDGYITRVYPDAVCMAILEYFAFESRAPTAHIARASFRQLTRGALRHTIYEHCDYSSGHEAAESWAHLHHRLALNPLPAGYFSVFREITDLLIATVQSGLTLDQHTMPDISVGMAWGRHWSRYDLDDRLGERIKHPYHLPANSGKRDIETWLYPITALTHFRTWMRDEYVPQHLPPYLRSKAKRDQLATVHIDRVLASVGAPAQ